MVVEIISDSNVKPRHSTIANEPARLTFNRMEMVQTVGFTCSIDVNDRSKSLAPDSLTCLVQDMQYRISEN